MQGIGVSRNLIDTCSFVNEGSNCNCTFADVQLAPTCSEVELACETF